MSWRRAPRRGRTRGVACSVPVHGRHGRVVGGAARGPRAAGPLFSPHEADAAATAFGAAYLRIVALCPLPQAIELALDGAPSAPPLAPTMPPMIVGIVLSTARVPLAWWAVENGYGVSGIWAVIAITAACAACSWRVLVPARNVEAADGVGRGRSR
ncbi:MAG: hypothetical protein R3F05_14850 [Planctomycetota bacterium]